MRPALILSLAKKNGVDIPAEDEAGVRKWLRFRDFPHFLEVYQTVCKCLKEPEDFHCLALDFLAEQAIQNIRWSEVHFTIATHVLHGRNADEVRQALHEAVRDGEKRHGIRMRLIPDIVRGYGPELADVTLEWALAGHREGLVSALGLSGDESQPHESYLEHFAAARKAELPVVAHVGEHRPPDEMRRVLDDVAPERIDHGIQAVGDDSLLADLVEKQTPLTVCPTSNVVLGAVPSMGEHPFRPLAEAGANVSVNCDDSQLFSTNLTREYVHLHAAFGYSAQQLADFARAGIRQAFLEDGERAELEGLLVQRAAELGQRYLGEAVHLENAILESAIQEDTEDG